MFVDLLRRVGDDEAAVSAAVTASLMLGWLAFGDFLVTATDAVRGQTDRAVASAVRALLENR